MPHDWRSAFLTQARSDYRVYQRLLELANIEQCHRLHYLQMATEKLAKAFLTDGTRMPRTVHSAFVRFLQLAKQKQNARVRKTLRMPSGQFRAFLDGLLTTGQAIEHLVPEGSGQRINVEYPWQGPDHTVSVPAESTFELLGPRGFPKVGKIRQLMEAYFQAYGCPI